MMSKPGTCRHFVIHQRQLGINMVVIKRVDCINNVGILNFMTRINGVTGLQIYGGPGSLSHDFKIWPITFQGSGPSGPFLFSCEKISL